MQAGKRFKKFTGSLVLIFTSTIRPQAKIDNFAFKNSNIIIEGLI